MLLYLLVLELEDLQTVREGGLCGARFCEEIDCASIWEGLLNVFVGEPHYLVAVWPDFAPDSVRKNDLFLSVGVDSLKFAVLAACFLHDSH